MDQHDNARSDNEDCGNNEYKHSLAKLIVDFPLAPEGSVDVLDFLTFAPQGSLKHLLTGWVAGRIVMNYNSIITIQSRGAAISVYLESNLNEQFQTKMHHGDLIAIKLDVNSLQFETDHSEDHQTTELMTHNTDLMANSAKSNSIRRVVSGSARITQASELLLLVKSKGPIAYTPFDYATSLKWNKMMQAIRLYFITEDFIELDTPTLVSCPGTEPFLDVFSTDFKFGKKHQKFYLPTSPEISLKKAIVRGWTKVFELKRCFRNGELSDLHQSEFTMLEWYRAYERPKALQEDFFGLLKQFKNLGLLDAIPEVINVPMSYLFKSILNFTLTPTTSFEELLKLCIVHDLDVHGTDTWDDLYNRIMIEKLEPTMKDGNLWIISEFPPSQSAFARLTEAGWADRFEIYWKGLELANAFHELNDSEENLTRQLRDLDLKSHHNKEEIGLDGDFQAHMLHGLPPTSGIALGVDRLFMAINDIHEIADTRLLPNVV